MWLTKLFGDKVSTQIPLYFYNSLTRKKQEFTSLPRSRTVRMYNCGPTVYDISHIGNLRSYVLADLIRRVLEFNGFLIKQVINITDFGHLSSDADFGEDKMTQALKRAGMTLSLQNMRKLAEKYTELFIVDLKRLHIDVDHITFPRASDHIKSEIALIQTLEEKGYTYRGKDGLYYDTSRFREYGKLGEIDIAGLRRGARVAAAEDKRAATDFLLWKSDERIGWESPWGRGFPGWHIECSAMINATLGKQIDIHTGGIDLLPTHHNNEIAQSEPATGKKPLSRFWIHNAFLNLEKEKISKSVGNVINLSTLIEKGFHPLSYRYYLLGAHYRSPLDFSWRALESAQSAFLKLRRFTDTEQGLGTPPLLWREKIHQHFNDDLDTPGALASIWNMMSDRNVSSRDARATLLEADKIMGLGLAETDAEAIALYAKLFGVEVPSENVPQRIQTLLNARQIARAEKKWPEADRIRRDVEKLGYSIEDTSSGPRLFKKS